MLSALLSNPDWDVRLRQASSQGLLPALRRHVQSLGLEPTVPSEVLQVMAAAETLNGERNISLINEAVYAAGLLNQIGLTPVALKGLAYLLTGVYPNPASRYLIDIDFLLPKHQIPAAITHLTAAGYFENESGKLLQFRHHDPSIKRQDKAPIEIHHRVGQGICARLLPAETILKNAKPLTVNGSTFLIPSPTDLANHLILHSQLAHPYHQRIFPPLRAIVDLVQLQERFGPQIDWAGLAATYKQHNQSATLTLHLKQAGLQPFDPPPMSLILNARWKRRQILNRYPNLRFADPTYILMSLLSRRLRILPEVLKTPKAWPEAIQAILHVGGR